MLLTRKSGRGRRGNRAQSFRGFGGYFVAMAVSGVLGCGPSLNAPASNNVTGSWFSAGPAAGLTNITIQLSQNSEGAITGTYAATGTSGLQFCPATGPCGISGNLGGSNTVLQVYFEMADAGQFSGQLVRSNALEGAMSRAGVTQPITFSRQP